MLRVKSLSTSTTIAATFLVSSTTTVSSRFSSSSSSSSRQWGDWNDSSSSNTNTSSSSSYSSNPSSSTYQRWDSTDSENMSRINNYDSRAFAAAGRTGTTIICRQKPIVKSYTQLAMEYLRPKKEVANSYIDSQQLAKIVGYLVIPVLTIIFWKGHYEDFPDYWERQAASVQSKPLNDSEGQKKKYSYFDVIESLESRRENEMIRKGYGSQSTTPASDAVKS